MSAFSSALANLDDSLQTVYSELACLAAGLEVDDEKLSHNLTDARYQAAVLRDLIRAERPAAEWSSRQALDRVVHELEVAAKTKRNQPRRTRLAELADELEVGTITHRSDTRATLLNELRDDAIAELRREATNPNSVNELPGPDAQYWLGWFCRLAENAPPMQEVRANFPALERFAAEMEERYWMPGTPSPAEDSAQNLDTPAYSTTRDNDAWASEVPARPEPSLYEVAAAFQNAARTGSYENALALCYATADTSDELHAKPATTSGSPRATRELPVTEPLGDVITSAPHTKFCNSCGGTFPNDFRMCPFDNAELKAIAVNEEAQAVKQGRTRRGAGQSARKMTESRRSPKRLSAPQPVRPSSVPAAPPPNSEVAETEVQRLKDVMVQRNGGDPQSRASFTTVRPTNRLLVAAGTAGAVIFSVALAAGLHLNFSDAGKLRTTVVEAGAKAAGIEDENVPDSVLQTEVQQKVATLKGSSVQATVENGVVTLVGHSPSKWEQLHAESLATITTGVKSVKNLIQVDSPPPAPAKNSRAS